MSNAVERLFAGGAAASLTPDTALAFLSSEGPSLIVCFGDPSTKPEAHDVAVVVSELLRSHAGPLQVGLVGPENDAQVRRILGISKVPSVSFARGGRIEEVLGGIQDWARYEAAVSRLLAASEAVP